MIKPTIQTVIHKPQWLFLLCGTLSTLLYCYLSIHSSNYGQADIFHVGIALLTCFILTIVCFFYAHQYKIEPTLFCVIAFAIAFRLIGLSIFPLFEDDFYRYLWDGRTLVEYGSPYGIAPSDFFEDDSINETFEDILDSINHPDVPTIYGPVLQAAFAASYMISPGALWPLKLIIISADIFIIFLLAQKVKPKFLLLYAWSPLIIKEFAITAHPDIIGVAFMVAALFAQQAKYVYSAAILLALSFASKVFALIIVPLLLGFHFKRWLVFIATALLVALPFGIIETWLPEGLVAMKDEWLFNAPIYIALHTILSVNVLKPILLVVFSLGWLILFFRPSFKQKPLELRGDRLFAIFLLCTPVLNPWYLIWLLPYATIFPSVWAWTASFCVLLSYLSGINLQGNGLELYDQSLSILMIEFGLIGVALIIDVILKATSRDSRL